MTVVSEPPVIENDPAPEIFTQNNKMIIEERDNCKSKESSSEFIVIQLRDLESIAYGKNLEFVCPGNITVDEFLKEVKERLDFDFEFELVYQDLTGIHDLSKMTGPDVFPVLNIVPSKDKVYKVNLSRKRKRRVKFSISEAEKSDDGTGNASGGGDTTDSYPGPLSIEYMNSKRDALDDADDDYTDILKKEFVGLKNQQQTCYLNVLIQSLFFCPEFRNCIYAQTVQPDPEKRSIIQALQRIFLQLQFSTRNAIEIDELTKTFGWKDNHFFVQHDIEEMYRALIDLCSNELKTAGKPPLAESLFAGVMNDYVECLECLNRNSKLELSVVLSLPITAYGQKLNEPTIEEALRCFVSYETLNGNNQYQCEKCRKLVDAHKGISFKQLPYFLSIQLRRWEYDFYTMARKKLNDRVSFPFVLNMNEFMDSKDEGGDKVANLVQPIEPESIGSFNVKAPNERLTHSRPAANSKSSSSNKAKSIIQPYSRLEEVRKYLQDGPNVYQLLSVLVHQGGSSHRGHYFAYIYDFEKGAWYLCNDSVVRKVSETEVTNTFGSYNSSYFSEDEEKGQAYMLIYRKYDEKINTFPMTWDELPLNMRDLWGSMEGTDREVHSSEVYEKSIKRIRVFYKQDEESEGEYASYDAIISKQDSMKEIAKKCYSYFNPGAEVSDDCIRVVRFNPDLCIFEESWEGRENEEFITVYRRPTDERREALFLQEKLPNVPFEPYHPDDMIFKTYLVNYESEEIGSYMEIHMDKNGTVGDLRDKIGKVYGLQTPSNLVITYRFENSTTSSLLINDIFYPLKNLKLYRCTEIRVQEVSSVKEIPILLDFINNLDSSYNFSIQCQVPNAKEMNDVQKRFRIDSENELHINGDLPDSDPTIQFEFDPLEQHLNEKNEDLGIGKDFSDNSTSEESLTGSEKTIVGLDSLGSSPTKVELFEPDNLAPNVKKENGNGMIPTPEYFFRVIERNKYAKDWECIKVRASTKMPIGYLSKKLSSLLKLSESEFILYGVHNGLEKEYFHNECVALENLERFDGMKTRIGHRLSGDELRIPIYLLDLKSNDLRNPPYLMDVVLNKSLSAAEIKETCISYLTSNISCLKFDFDKILLRRKKGLTPSKVLRDSFEFRNFTPTEIYVELLENPIPLPTNSHIIMVFQWAPSKLTMSKPFEISFINDNTQKLETIVGSLISSALEIPIERLEFCTPDGPEVEFPYEMNPLTLLEKTTWNSFLTSPTSRRCFTNYSDEGFLIVRDSSEVAYELSSDERKTYAMKSHEEYSFSPRKSEQGLNINLARTPPSH